MNSSLKYKMGLGCSFLLMHLIVAVLGSTCSLDRTCSAYSRPKTKILGCPDSSLLIDSTLTCPWKSLRDDVVTDVTWFFSTNDSTPKMIDVNFHPKLRQSGFNLILNNVTGKYEGTYYCQVRYTSNRDSSLLAAGCVFIVGRAVYKTCPDDSESMQCNAVTQLKGMTEGSIEFDGSLEFRHSGPCRQEQNVRLMFLRKLLANGNAETVYVCSNLASFGRKPCSNGSRVSVNHLGDHKYDIGLILHNLSPSDEGMYQVRVDLDDVSGGLRSTIIKRFNLTIKAGEVAPTETVETVDSTDSEKDCSPDTEPLLLLNGEELNNGTAITFNDIQENGSALMCVVANNATTANFLNPQEVAVGESTTHRLYVSRGERSLRLNHNSSHDEANGADEAPQGSYCCTADLKSTCITIN